jgi:hypothetical protein
LRAWDLVLGPLEGEDLLGRVLVPVEGPPGVKYVKEAIELDLRMGQHANLAQDAKDGLACPVGAQADGNRAEEKDEGCGHLEASKLA